jgi:hypothetical protein
MQELVSQEFVKFTLGGAGRGRNYMSDLAQIIRPVLVENKEQNDLLAYL